MEAKKKLLTYAGLKALEDETLLIDLKINNKRVIIFYSVITMNS